MYTQESKLVEHTFSVVDGPQREANSRVLQPILTDLIAFGLMVKQFHWNLFGPQFMSIHLQLDKIYEDVLEATDSVAERMTACGHSPLGIVSVVARDTELMDPPTGFLYSSDVLRLAGQRVRELVGLIRSRMQTIEAVDTVTADLLHRVVGELEKHHWMLQAEGAQEPSLINP